MKESLNTKKRFNADVCKINISNYELRLVKPQTYMNASGYSVQSILNYYKLSPEQLLVAHDEIDLSPDKIRFKNRRRGWWSQWFEGYYQTLWDLILLD